jgi:multiple sugar transport system permease protein
VSVVGPQAQTQLAVPPKVRPLAERGSPLEWVLMHVAFLAIAAFFLAPFVWLFTAAFDAQAQAYIRWPSVPTFDNFVEIFERYAFATALGNSVFVAVSTMLLTVLVVSLAGYSLSRIELRQKTWITYAVLLLQTMPLSATMVPIYGLARELGLRNSYLGLILIHAAIELPFLVWLMKGFFDSVPRHLEEAAWLDGRTKWRALFEIVVPVARPGIAVAAGLSFLSAWAEVLMVLILVDRQEMKTIPLAFYETFRTAGGYTEVQYGLVAAMAVLYVLPVMAVFFATRRLMVRGLMSSTRGL